MVFASLALMVMASFGLLNLTSVSSVDASMIKFDNEKSITITNGSFSSFSSSSAYPYKLNSFTTSGNSTPEMKTGAINISDKDYAKHYTKYGLTEYQNPKGVGTDNYILMINADKDSNYTYTSSEFTLPANGYYYITVSAKTIGDNAIASVFLTKDNVIFEDCLIENIKSSEWSNYTFFVSTNAYESVTLKFGMQIGSQTTGASGCVLFDELHAGQISSERLNDCVATFPAGSFKNVEFRSPNAYKTYNFNNQVVDYSQDSNGVVANKNYFATSTSGAGEKNFEIENNTITLTSNNSYLRYKGEEEVLQPNSTYRFSIFVKASEIKSGSAFVQLDEILKDDDNAYDDPMESTPADNTPKSSNLKISSATSNTITDGYKEYVIYVNTSALTESTVQFSFGLGSDTENATGNVTFKSYQIERVPYSAFDKASAGSEVGKIDISERNTSASGEYANYNFNKMQSDSFDGVQYPATPSSWTKKNDSVGYQLSGVVNLSAFDKVMDKYSSEVNRLATPATLNGDLNNNVLMIYNGTNSTHSYTSASKSLSANKNVRITVFVNTYLWDNTANGVTILAKTGSNILGQATGIKTNGQWQRVTFNIQTPANSVDLTLEMALGYGAKTSSGYAFFDNIMFEEKDSNDFSSRFDSFEIAENGNIEIDLNNPMLSATTTREYNTPVLYVGSNQGKTNINAGIVDLTGDLKMVAESKRQALRSLTGDNKNVLAIATSLEEDGHYTYTSVIDYKFDSEKYYKFSFDLFTDGISQQDKEQKYDNGRLAEGVNVSLSNLENAKFNYIQSNGKWTSYEMYIGVNSSTTSTLTFSLGSEFTGCYGRAFIGNINVIEVEEVDFNASSNTDTMLKIDAIEQDEEETTTSEETKGNNFNWQYIPTIATFAAIVIAVVGVFVRRNMKFKKRVGGKKVDYDRDITVMQNKYRRIASDTRDKEVRELTKECNELVALRTEYEDKYKDALSRLRSTRLANRDGSKHHEIVAIEREVKHISKEVARFGVQINNYESEIEFMKTEAYLIDLEKRMMREDNFARNQVRKESEMSEEKRAEAIAKREEKQARAELKAQNKADKLARKQQKLEQERKEVQDQLAKAKELDEKYLKEQELKKIKIEEQKVAKEKAKAERELQKLEQAKLAQAKAEAERIAKQTESTDDNAVEGETEQVEETEQTTEQTEEQVAEQEETLQEVENVQEVEQTEVAPVEVSEQGEEESKPEVVEQTAEETNKQATEQTSETANEQVAEQTETTDNE